MDYGESCESSKMLQSVIEAENGRRASDAQPNWTKDPTTKKKIIFMEEALAKTNFGKFNYFLIFMCGLSIFATIIESVGIAFVLPVTDCDLKLSTSQKGVIGAAPFAGMIFSAHFWGLLSDIKGRRYVLIPSLFAGFASSVICSFVESFYLFASLRFFNGIFMCCASATIYAYVDEFHSSNNRSRAIMATPMVFGTFCLTIPILAWFCINLNWQFDVPFLDLTYKPWRLFIIVCALPAFISALALCFLPETPKFVLSQGDQTGAYEILRNINRWNNGKNAPFDSFEIQEEAESIANRQRNMKNKDSRFGMLKTIWHQTAPLFKRPYLKSTVFLCMTQFSVYFACNGFYMFFAEIVNKMSTNLDDFYNQRIMMCDAINMKANVTATELQDPINVCNDKLELSTLINGIYMEIAFTSGHFMIGFLINKVGKFPILFVVFVVCGLSGIGCMLTDIPALQLAFFISHLTVGILTNIVNSVAVESYPTVLRAMGVSIELLFGRIGSVFGANVAALLLDNYCEATFYLSGSLSLALGLLSFFIPNIHKKIEDPPIDLRLSVMIPRGSIISLTK